MAKSPESSESEKLEPYEEYNKEMEDALADAMVECAGKGNADSIRVLLKESLEIDKMFDFVLRDTKNEVPLDHIQQVLDQKVTLLGLPLNKFDIHRFKELIDISER